MHVCSSPLVSSVTGRPRATWVMAFAVVLLVPLAAAHAAPPDEAIRAYEEGRVEDARSILLDHLIAEPTDPDVLLADARAAAVLGDVDLVERVQGRIEVAMAAEDPGPTLSLALATASLAHARLRLAAGDTSSDLAFLFADAESSAQAVIERGGRLAAEAVGVLARARHAQGDLAGALAVLEGHPGARAPRTQALHGRLLYERAMRHGLAPDGRPNEAGLADLQAAWTTLEAVDPEALGRDEAFQTLLTQAYAAHRLGRLEPASAAYEAAHRRHPHSDLALRGLQSLWTGRPPALEAALGRLLAARRDDLRALDALVQARLAAEDATGALLTLQRRLEVAPDDPAGWTHGGRIFLAWRQYGEAERHFAHALEVDAGHQAAASGMERVAVALMEDDVARGVAVYEHLFALRPDDPYVRNNLGFLLREVVSPHTEMGEGGLQRLREEAPPAMRRWLERSVEAYRDAVALIPAAEDGDRDELEAWNLAGIVNDYGLMLHYFVDVQDAREAEALYHRALRMTDHGFKDTYIPNLRRLYAYVLPGRGLTWYRVARAARDAILREEPLAGGGGLRLVPDDEKRALAEQDMTQLRVAIARQLARDAAEDGAPWPPPAADEDGAADDDAEAAEAPPGDR